MTHLKKNNKELEHRGAAIAQRIHLCHPSCRHRFNSRAHHQCFYHYSQFVLHLSCETNENKQKEAGFGSSLKKN